MATVVVVSAYSQGQIVLERTAVRCAGSFEDLFYESVVKQKTRSSSLNISLDSVKKISVRPQPSAAPIIVSTDMDVSILAELNCKFVDFEIQSFESQNQQIYNETDSHSQNLKSSSHKKDAFTLLMQQQTNVELPKKPTSKEKLTGPERLYCDVIDLAESLECG